MTARQHPYAELHTNGTRVGRDTIRLADWGHHVSHRRRRSPRVRAALLVLDIVLIGLAVALFLGWRPW